ncbi:MAG: DUF927 domain-containing protein, partial [Clostridiales bacterium]|nr:DUF927 domain-containing protein [Clostridiales bacterium]
MKDNQDYHIADAISFAEMEGLDRLHEEDEALIANVAGDVETQADLTEITRYQALEIKDSRKKQFAQNPNHEIDKGPLTAFKGQALALHTGKWETDENGIWKLTKRGELILVCHQQLTIEGILVNRKTGIEKVVLAFREGGTWNRITVPRHVAQSNSAIVKLADRGLAVSSVNASSVVSYLYALLTLNQEIIPRINGAFHLGWQNGGFIPYTGEDGFDGEACFKSLFESVSRKGSKDVWLKSMKEMRDNMIIRLATSASVASALIEPLDAQVFLLHIWGVSEINRPVALTAAASIWGNPKWDNLVFLMNNSLSYFIKVACVLKNIPFFGDRMD